MARNAKPQLDIDARYRTLLILWIAQLMSIGVLYLVGTFFGPAPSTQSLSSPSALTFAFAAVAMILVILSFVVKGKLLARSVQEQKVELVQNALIVACAMCEGSALLGLVERFVARNSDYNLFFLLAVVGIALHFPKREQLLSATYKSTSQESIR